MNQSPVLIYGPSGPITLIGRGWNLFKLAVKPALLLMLIPLVCFALESFLSSLQIAIPTLTRVFSTRLLMSLLLFSGGLAMVLLSQFAALFSSCAVSRIFYMLLTENRLLTVGETLRFMRSILPGLLVLVVVTFVLFIGFAIADVVIGLAGLFGTGMAMTLVSLAGKSSLTIVAAIIFMLVLGFLVVALLAVLLSMQIFFCFLPFVAVATSEGKRMTDTVLRSWRLLWGNLPRAMLFGTLLMLFSLVLWAVLYLPAGLWSIFELQRLAANNEFTNPGSLPVHVHFVNSLWNSLVNMIVYPFLSAAMTLFWYDCQVRREGKDMALWLNRLRSRLESSQRGSAS